jgi:hypothetical protein
MHEGANYWLSCPPISSGNTYCFWWDFLFLLWLAPKGFLREPWGGWGQSTQRYSVKYRLKAS